MSTTIIIHTGGTVDQNGGTVTLSGGIIAARTYANDTKAQAALLAYYLDQHLGEDDATNRQKLEAIVDHIANTIAEKAKQRHAEQARDAAQEEADETYGFE